MQIIGEKDIFGGLQSHLVPLFFLQKDILRLLLPLCQVLHHIIQGVNFQNIRGFEVLKSRLSPADTLHQPLNWAGQVPHREVDAQHTKDQANQHRGHNPDIELPAHAEQVHLRIQAQKRPFGILIGHMIAIQPQRTHHRINALSVQTGALYSGKPLIAGLLQHKFSSSSAHQVVEQPLAHQRRIAVLLPFHRQQIPRLLGIIQFCHWKIVHQAPAGYLYAQDPIDLPLIPQGQRVSDHLMGICPVLFQRKRQRPVSQIGGVGIWIFHTGPPWFIKIVVRGTHPLSIHMKPRSPVGVQRNIPRPGQLFAPPLQQQVCIVGRICVWIRVPDKKPVKLPGRQSIWPRQNQKHSSGRVVLQNVQALWKQLLQQSVFHFP